MPRSISLWGTFQGCEKLEINEAWDKYSHQVAGTSKEEWVESLEKITSIRDSKKLVAVKLANLQEAVPPIVVNDVLPNLTIHLQKGKTLSESEVATIFKYHNASLSCQLTPLEIDEEGSDENIKKLIRHMIRERNNSLVRNAKAKWRNDNPTLPCSVCKKSFMEVYGKEYIEAHHIIPLSGSNEKRKTKIKDLAPVCPSCHRALHLTTKTIKDLQKIFEGN